VNAGNYETVGKSTRRLDGPDKVTGHAIYAIDVAPADTLWCKFLRSPLPHARVTRFDASRALALPGVHAVLAGDDLQGLRGGNIFVDEPLLSSWDKVRFIGDKVAAIAAVDEDTALMALDLIDVEYEELPAVFDPEEAAKPDAPLIHPEFNSYRNVVPIENLSNAFNVVRHEQGDIDLGFSQADLIIDKTYSTARVHQGYLEPHACTVLVDEQDRLQAWVSTQAPMARRVHLARLVGLERPAVILHPVNVGGGYGGKLDVTGVAVCYFLAKKTGRPVKFVMDYDEELMAMNPRHPSKFHIRAGVTQDGVITAWEVESFFATGGYAAYAPVPPFGEMSGRGMVESYEIPNLRVVSHQVYTNTVPGGYFRAPGGVQATFAGESHMDSLARAVQMRPHEFRIQNLRVHDKRGAQQELPADRHDRFVETVRTAIEASRYSEPRPEGVGRGIAISEHGQIGFEGHVEVSIEQDGRILARMSTFDPGMGTGTVLAQVVAEELGVNPERIRVEPWSTEDGPRDQGVGGSRGTRVTTIAASEAARDLKTNLLRLAAEFHGWNEETATVRGGMIVNGSSGEQVAMETIPTRAGTPVMGKGDIDEGMSPAYSSAVAHVAEVSVDRDSGQVTLLRYTAVHETGQVINPVGFEGQIEGGVSQGIGQALTEELLVDDGRVINPSFADYKFPSVADAPEFKSIVLDSPVGHGPYNVRGVGEAPITMPAPAIANAIEDAVGARVTDLPITAEKVLTTLKESGDTRS
jgi:CO/xanthine dehydrogenase Mo-binding subunit